MFGRIHLSAALIGASTAVLLGIAPAGAAEIDDLKAKVEALEKKVGDIAATSVSISGYVKADFYLDNRDDLGNTFGNGATVRLDDASGDDDEDGAVGMHAQQSRFALSTSTPTSFGALNTVAEIGFDPYVDAPGSPFVRLANGALGPVLAGLAWSIRGDDHTGADTVDFDGPAGVVADTPAAAPPDPASGRRLLRPDGGRAGPTWQRAADLPGGSPLQLGLGRRQRDWRCGAV